jgi:Domain of unknown function (DUF6484)
MSEREQFEVIAVEEVAACDAAELLRPLMQGPAARATEAAGSGLLIGRLLALVDEGRTPLVEYPGQPVPAALKARTTVDLHGAHVGQDVVLGFEQQDPTQPIVLGVVRGQPGWPLPEAPGQVTLEADGQRMVVTAQRELVLRCGKASVSLRHDGRVEIRGESILTDATAANRVRGGSVELN